MITVEYRMITGALKTLTLIPLTTYVTGARKVAGAVIFCARGVRCLHLAATNARCPLPLISLPRAAGYDEARS
jgi:hypothetical protein